MGNGKQRRVREMFTTDYDDILAHEAALEERVMADWIEREYVRDHPEEW